MLIPSKRIVPRDTGLSARGDVKDVEIQELDIQRKSTLIQEYGQSTVENDKQRTGGSNSL